MRCRIATLVVIAAVGAGGLGSIAALHPGLRFVDMVSFSARAQDLASGLPARDGLYPLGYPAFLVLAHALSLDVLVAGKAMAVGAAAGLAVATSTRLGPLAALWLIVQVPVVQWGTTEGTDMLAAGLSLSALLVSRHGMTSGVLLGLALSTRWTAAAFVVPLLLLSPARGRALAGLALGLLAHLVPAAWSGSAPWPDQGLNAAIAGGGSVLARLRAGLGEVPPVLLPDAASRLGGVALVAAAVVGPSTPTRSLARALLVGALLHGLGLAAMFANPRLSLPGTLAAYLGLPLLACALGARGPGWRRGAGVALLLASVAAAAWGQRRPLEANADEARAEKVAALAARVPGGVPLLSNTPWAHLRSGGWLHPARQASSLGAPHTLSPSALSTAAPGAWCLLDGARGRGFPGLGTLLKGEPTAGWSLVERDGALLLWAPNPSE